MSLAQLFAIPPEGFDVLSVDLFDTVPLRDHSLQCQRFAAISSVVATQLRQSGYAVDPGELTLPRSRLHALSYRFVAIERSEADATLTRTHALRARVPGLPENCQKLLRQAELMVECKRLHANRRLLAVLRRFAAGGKRVIATSDTYYASSDLEWLLSRVVGPSPIMRLYLSGDVGLTKHAGALFAEVAVRQRVGTARILHCGNDLRADVMPAARRADWYARRVGVAAAREINKIPAARRPAGESRLRAAGIRMAGAAGCQAVHLPCPNAVRLARKANAARFVITHAAAMRSAA
jgi:FMN phosphatase YigB (HAD superfamily)